MPGLSVDGTDIFAVSEAVSEAIERARQGEGPSLVECKAFRYYGHFEGDAVTYYTEEMREDFRERDPIKKFRENVLERELVSEETLTAIDEKVENLIEEAVAFAEQSPMPDPEEVTTDVYVSYG